MITMICSFGYKWGEPETADPRIDVRHAIPNPHRVPTLRDLNGLDPKVVTWFIATPHFYETYLALRSDAERAQDAALKADPDHAQILWVGCHGGRHRSVYVADRLGRDMGLLVEHRDLRKGDRMITPDKEYAEALEVAKAEYDAMQAELTRINTRAVNLKKAIQSLSGVVRAAGRRPL